MRRTPLAVVVGFVARSPVAGMALYNFHYIRGLLEMGYDVHYVERLNGPDECYNPDTNAFSDEPFYGLRFLQDCMKRDPSIATPWTLIDRNDVAHGAGRPALRDAISRADFVLTLADPTWFDDLALCPRRAFLDGDPLFTQARLLQPGSPTAIALENYPILYTYWMRQGAPDTTVPAANRTWISTTPVISTSMWRVCPPRLDAPITTVMNWGGWADVELDGQVYGHKNREFERLIDLPTRTSHALRVAVGGPAPKQWLEESGWTLANPLDATRTIEAYRAFIDDSYADLGVAKHAYVASKCGWFSDRALCYLASGRPVLHQDTGFTDWLPTGEGVLPFTNLDDVLAGLRKLDEDYPRHARAARAIAEDRFEARKVIGRMLCEGGLR